MSPEDVIRQLFHRWQHTDRGIDLFADDVVWDMTGTTTAEGVYHGHAGVDEFLDEWMRPWHRFRCVLEHLERAPDGRIAVRFIQSGQPHGSDVRLEQHFGALFRVEDGLITRAEHFDRPEDAWAAAGIVQNPPP